MLKSIYEAFHQSRSGTKRPSVPARQTPVNVCRKEKAVLIIANIFIVLVALLHVCFMVLEMFYWDKPLGLKAFGLSKEDAAASKVLAANQGLYNGFLAAGLLWGVGLGSAGAGIKLFFLSCVLIAGLYGAATANRKILFFQAVPGAIGLLLVMLS